MSVKQFSKTLWQQILDPIDQHIKNHPGPHFAAFDADGTLWDSDVGENFFQYQIDYCNLPLLKNLDSWQHYKTLKEKHPPTAYLWLAQISQQYSLQQVRTWATEAIKKFPPLIFADQKKLISELKSRGIVVYVVSASVLWAVEAAMPLVGLDSSSAIGVRTKVKNDIVTSEQEGFVTWREGKTSDLLVKTNGIKPLFASGNSSGDVHLLECAKIGRLAIQTQKDSKSPPSLFSDEQALLNLAKTKNWLTHQF